MFSTHIRRSFFTKSGRNSINLSTTSERLKQALKAPIKHWKRLNESNSGHNSPWTNTTAEAFDEVSQEWQALIIGNPYDLQTYNYLQAVSSNNFGTLDNPHVVFTADAPFRFVICCGPADVDDYEGHEALFFMIREGPLQRCMGCGQVFKLVRLRNEFSPDQDYYQSNFLPYEINEMGEQETHSTSSLFRFTTQYEPTRFEVPSNVFYSLINNDDHDRVIVDPAYRLQKLKEVTDTIDIYHIQFEHLARQIDLQQQQKDLVETGNQYLSSRVAMSKQDFVTMLEVEQTINKLDRMFQKVDKFNNRQFTDPDNHHRREKRMRNRAKERWDSNYTFFTGGLTEEEQKYRDYYQTDLELNPEIEVLEQIVDKQEQSERYRLQKYDFQEMYTGNPEDDQSSFLQRKIFLMKYRQFNMSLTEHQEREKKMIANSLSRYQSEGRHVLNTLYNNIHNNQDTSQSLKDWVEYQVKEGLQQYKDYYYDDKDYHLLHTLVTNNNQIGVELFQNLIIKTNDFKELYKIPKRTWNQNFGIWQNFLYELKDFNENVIPQSQQLSDELYAQKFRPISQEEIDQLRKLQITAQDNKKQ